MRFILESSRRLRGGKNGKRKQNNDRSVKVQGIHDQTQKEQHNNEKSVRVQKFRGQTETRT